MSTEAQRIAYGATLPPVERLTVRADAVQPGDCVGGLGTVRKVLFLAGEVVLYGAGQRNRRHTPSTTLTVQRRPA